MKKKLRWWMVVPLVPPVLAIYVATMHGLVSGLFQGISDEGAWGLAALLSFVGLWAGGFGWSCRE